jgi:hypothetical protein
MKPRHADALALVVWYQMTAPYSYHVRGTVTDLHLLFPAVVVHRDTAAPLSRWRVGPTFATQKECEAARDPFEQCVATDDPRLKGN